MRYYCLALIAAAAFGLGIQPGLARDAVKVGINGYISDTPLYIAQEKGFFEEQGIAVTLIDLTTGGQMSAPLASGQLDVGAGSLSVGLYNSAIRGINTKIVADKSRISPRSTYLQLIIRKDLAGTVKKLGDLKGLKIGINGRWGVQASTINEFLKAGNLKFEDVEIVWNMSNPQQVVALKNGAIDAALTAEPAATAAFDQGLAAPFGQVADVYPDQEYSVLVYGENFISQRRDVAQRFMVAYIKGLRVYNDAQVDGFFKGPGANEVIDIIAKHTIIKDKALLARVGANGVDPDGKLNVNGMKKDLALFKQHKVLEGDIAVEALIDESFLKYAVDKLGPYRAPMR